MIEYAVVIAAVAGICSAMPAGAEEVGVGVGPLGVTVGEGHGDRYRDRDRDVIPTPWANRVGGLRLCVLAYRHPIDQPVLPNQTGWQSASFAGGPV